MSDRCSQCWTTDALGWLRLCEAGSEKWAYFGLNAKTGAVTQAFYPEVPACDHPCHEEDLDGVALA